MLQWNNFDFVFLAGHINPRDDLSDTIDIDGAIRNDQHVTGLIRHHMALLRNHGPQDGHQLRGGDVLQLDDPGDHLIALAIIPRPGHSHPGLFGIDIGDDLDDFSGGHGGKTMHLQHRQEDLIDLILIKGLAGDDGDLALDPGVDDEILACLFRNPADH
jgi:hypothetical protein